MLRFAPALTLALLVGPIGAGLIGTLLPAFGYFPSIGGHHLSVQPWRDLFAYPGIATSLRLTVVVGFLATLLSLALAMGFCALAHERPGFRALQRLLAPMLATPHVAIAIGFAFLIAPSGWLVRIVSPALTGWERPPPLAILRDPLGLSFAGGLLLKEFAYLVLMMIAASGQIAARPMTATARAMGYSPTTAWVKVVFPQIYRQIRLPVYAVLAFSLSVVEVALVLAPGNPPPLSVLAARWFSDYDLRLYYPAAAVAVLQLLIVVGSIGLWRLGEAGLGRLGLHWIGQGVRRGLARPLVNAGGFGTLVVIAVNLLSIAVIAVWSVAEAWPFPGDVPSRWTLATWTRYAGQVSEPALTTVTIGIGAAALAVCLALACLENERRRRLKPGAGALWLIYLPLLVPQIAFLFGTQVLLVRLGLDGTLAAVAWAHLLFVFPYVFLSLADPYRAIDPRYARIAAGLGASPTRTWLCVKLPMLLRPILVGLAVGFAVSVAQYLPTLFAGAGRVATLTTEAVTLSSGLDRRSIGVYAFLLSAVPLVIYGLALALPALTFRNRRGLA